MKEKTETITGLHIPPLSIRGRLLIFLSVLLLLGVTIYQEPLTALAVAVLQRNDSSHGLFVPFISAYLIWLRLDRMKGLTPNFAIIPGAALIGVGFILLGLSRNSEGIGFPILSFLLITAGLIMMLFGGQVFKEVIFPLFFLGAMIPLPVSAFNQIAEWMRQVTTWGAVLLMKPMSIPLHRDGYDIFLPNSHLYVGYACSGIRYLLSYLVFGVAYAFRFKRSFTGRALVVMCAFPLSIAGGVLRLSVIFSTVYFIGPIMLERRPHVLLSWTVFMMLLTIAILLDQYLSKKRTGVKYKAQGARFRVGGKDNNGKIRGS